MGKLVFQLLNPYRFSLTINTNPVKGIESLPQTQRKRVLVETSNFSIPESLQSDVY